MSDRAPSWLCNIYDWLIGLIFVLVATALPAQEVMPVDTFSREKIVVLVEPMQYPPDLPPQLVEHLQEVVHGTLENHWHFHVIDPENDAQKGALDPEYIIQLTLQPLVEDATQKDVRDSYGRKTGTDYFLAMGIRLNLRVTDIVSGELLYSQMVDSILPGRGRKRAQTGSIIFITGNKPNWSHNPRSYPYAALAHEEEKILLEEKSKLFQDAIERFPYIWQKALASIFPAPIHITDILEGSKRRPYVMRIDAGSDYGIVKGRPLEVYVYKTYEVFGEKQARADVVGIFIPGEVSANSTVGHIVDGYRDIGLALVRGEQVFLRFK